MPALELRRETTDDAKQGLHAGACPSCPTAEQRHGRPKVAARRSCVGADRIVRLAEHYQRPGWFTTHVFNRLVAALTSIGVSVYGSRVLEVRGRKSGEWRRTPVNLLRYGDAE